MVGRPCPTMVHTGQQPPPADQQQQGGQMEVAVGGGMSSEDQEGVPAEELESMVLPQQQAEESATPTSPYPSF